jgi:integrase
MIRKRRLLPNVDQFRDRYGHLRTYYRVGKGPRIPLPNNLASDEFREAYQAAYAGLPAFQSRERRAPPEPGTIAALVTSYLRSAAYVELRSTTKKGYASRIEAIRTKHGHRTVRGLTPKRIREKILEPYAGKPGARLAILKMLRVLIRHALAIGWLASDPSVGIRRPKTKEIRSWTDTEIARFEARWPVGTQQRLAFALHLYTGQRRSDIHRVTWTDLQGSKIRVVQQKTGTRLWIELHPNLRSILGQTPREHVTILNTEVGRPFTVDGYGNWLREAIEAAGLPLECKPHGIRKAAGRRLADAGCTAHEIMAILGHRTLAEAERYTREADQTRLAESAVIKLQGRKKNINSQTTSPEVGEKPIN